MTDDEFTVLKLLAEGAFLAPLGRWKAPLDSLHAQGLVIRVDNFNYTATQKGNDLVELRDHDDAKQVLDAQNVIATVNLAIQAATPHILTATRASAAQLSQPFEMVLDKILAEVRRAALAAHK